MFNSPVFETILSLVFIILVFSVIVSCIQEGFVSVMKLRGKMLQYAIREMLNDQQNKNFAHLLYQHPQIDMLKQKQTDLPSYISSGSFASALIDLIANESTETIYQKVGDTIQKKEVLKQQAIDNSPALKNMAMMSNQPLGDVPPSTIPMIAKFNAGVETLQHSGLKKMLQSFSNISNDANALMMNGIDDVAKLKDEAEKLKSNIEAWYNGYMQRVTGWYKRKVRKNIFVASAIVTLFFNVNVLSLTKSIYTNSSLRGTVVAMASSAGADSSFVPKLQQQFKNDSSLSKIDINAVIGAKLPIGWKIDNRCIQCQGKEGFANLWCLIRSGWCTFWHQFTFNNVLGWILFVLLLSLGAPFWFDVLRKVVNIRNSGQSPSENKAK